MEVREPDWAPLETVFAPPECAQFMYMGREDEIVLYKHRDTRRYLNIHATTGKFYHYIGGTYVEVDRESALNYVGG